MVPPESPPLSGSAWKRLRVTLLTLLLGLMVYVLGLFLWRRSGPPPHIPYESWNADFPFNERLPLAKTEPDGSMVRLRDDDLLNAGNSVFTMGVGSGLYGLDVFRVDAQGNARYVFQTGEGIWWEAEFELPVATLAKLRQLLVDVDYASLARAYPPTFVMERNGASAWTSPASRRRSTATI